MRQLLGHLTPTRLVDTPCATSAWKSIRAIKVAEQIDISVADAIPTAADTVGADDFAAGLGATEDRFCVGARVR
jgi:hypothetical protein